MKRGHEGDAARRDPWLPVFFETFVGLRV